MQLTLALCSRALEHIQRGAEDKGAAHRDGAIEAESEKKYDSEKINRWKTIVRDDTWRILQKGAGGDARADGQGAQKSAAAKQQRSGGAQRDAPSTAPAAAKRRTQRRELALPQREIALVDWVSAFREAREAHEEKQREAMFVFVSIHPNPCTLAFSNQPPPPPPPPPENRLAPTSEKEAREMIYAENLRLPPGQVSSPSSRRRLRRRNSLSAMNRLLSTPQVTTPPRRQERLESAKERENKYAVSDRRRVKTTGFKKPPLDRAGTSVLQRPHSTPALPTGVFSDYPIPDSVGIAINKYEENKVVDALDPEYETIEMKDLGLVLRMPGLHIAPRRPESIIEYKMHPFEGISVRNVIKGKMEYDEGDDDIENEDNYKLMPQVAELYRKVELEMDDYHKMRLRSMKSLDCIVKPFVSRIGAGASAGGVAGAGSGSGIGTGTGRGAVDPFAPIDSHVDLDFASGRAPADMSRLRAVEKWMWQQFKAGECEMHEEEFFGHFSANEVLEETKAAIARWAARPGGVGLSSRGLEEGEMTDAVQSLTRSLAPKPCTGHQSHAKGAT